MDDELRLHVELETERLQAARLVRAGGPPAGPARLRRDRADQRDLPRCTRDDQRGCGAARRPAGARRLMRDWRFTAAAVLILGLGIGATTAIFSLVNAVLFGPTAVAEPERLVEIYQNARESRAPTANSYPAYLDMAAFDRRLCQCDSRDAPRRHHVPGWHRGPAAVRHRLHHLHLPGHAGPPALAWTLVRCVGGGERRADRGRRRPCGLAAQVRRRPFHRRPQHSPGWRARHDRRRRPRRAQRHAARRRVHRFLGAGLGDRGAGPPGAHARTRHLRGGLLREGPAPAGRHRGAGTSGHGHVGEAPGGGVSQGGSGQRHHGDAIDRRADSSGAGRHPRGPGGGAARRRGSGAGDRLQQSGHAPARPRRRPRQGSVRQAGRRRRARRADPAPPDRKPAAVGGGRGSRVRACVVGRPWAGGDRPAGWRGGDPRRSRARLRARPVARDGRALRVGAGAQVHEGRSAVVAAGRRRSALARTSLADAEERVGGGAGGRVGAASGGHQRGAADDERGPRPADGLCGGRGGDTRDRRQVCRL